MTEKISTFEDFLETLKDIKEEDIKNDENIEERLDSFLISFYKNNDGAYTIKKQEYINNLLNILINKISDNKNGCDLFINLLCIHFKNITPNFINIKLKDDIYYIHLIINYILYVLKNIQQGRYLNFYLKIIDEGKFIYLLYKICFDNDLISYYIPEDKTVELFFVLIKIKELEEYIIHCDMIKYFLSFLLYDIQVIKIKEKYLILEIIIHVFLKNKDVVKDFIKKNSSQIIINILKYINDNIKNDTYDYYCLNLLKLFYYIIEDKNIVSFQNIFFFYPNKQISIIPHKKKEDDIFIFYKYINCIIIKINDLIKYEHSMNNILNDNKQEEYHFKYFLSIFLCVLKNIITIILEAKNNIQQSAYDDNKREDVYEEITKFLNITFDCVVRIIDIKKGTPTNEEEIYELLSYDVLICMTKINSLKYYNDENISERIFKLVNNIIDDDIIKNKYNDETIINTSNRPPYDNNNNNNNYYFNNSCNNNVLPFVNKIYVKHFECLFYLCLYKETNIIHFININFIRYIENNIYKIYKYYHLCDINTKDLLNYLSLYYLVIIFIYIKNNLNDKEKIHVVKKLIKYIIIKEIKEKIFLFKNKLYFLAFIKLLNLSICNNLFEFKILLCQKYFDDFIQIFEGSQFNMKALMLHCILEWTQIHHILKKLQIYINKNKYIFHVFFKLWKEIEYENRLKNKKYERQEVNILYKNNYKNVQFILFRIIKILTNDFTNYIDYIINNKDLVCIFKNIIIYEKEHVLLHKEEENLLLEFLNLYKEDIKKLQRIFENVSIFYNKKDNKELQNYYDSLRENKRIE
ncbi:conserved Plasmodium protein, unknown function [Plasmodium sp. gorilla clade G2]|uniref:conserved Plasmodium protein, unknown function n=1 Tax=Plasmodium sp. gorilla clade G2 TaxID=880535 RepID=UPI000D221CB9|nr:conserved Plasmodium protein, unknown function [Plasmodium sp. gorilla clade G2]SOV16084.1 conserved Plasmodium protein, unknown function [Plasmodium sp. gorilla clade G2]